jgi:hypothetical protein
MSQSADLSSERFWWVNQNKTHREEIAGGFMWSPKANANGSFNQFYANMAETAFGDIVFSYYDKHIRQVGVVAATAETMPKPEFESAGQKNNWSREGWLVGVEYKSIADPVRPKDHIEVIRPLLPDKYSPLRQNGDGRELYLAEISRELATVLLGLADTPLPQTSLEIDPGPSDTAVALEDQEIASIQGRTDIGAVVKTQLVKARLGQGIFRTNVRMNESRCRVTSVSDPAHLRASHIKPWKDSTDVKKLHGCNGLLLAPHVDHLFDRGWISFSDEGDLLISRQLGAGVLEAWSVPHKLNVGSFNEKQKEFLGFHRASVFRS